MATKTKSKNTKKKKPRKAVKPFSLENVLAVGGDKDDFEMLKDVSVEGDLSTDTQGKDSIAKDEILSMIKDLGLDKVTADAHESDEEPKVKSDSELSNDGDADDHTLQGPQKHHNEDKQEREKKDENENEKADFNQQHESVELQNKLLIKPGGKWYDQVYEEDRCNTSLPANEVARLLTEARQVWQNDVDLYQKIKTKHSSSETSWLKTVATSGTLGDRVASLTLQVQESPVHQVKALEMLVNMSRKKGRRESMMAIETLKELWLEDLLLQNRKLKQFAQQPLGVLKNKGKVSKDGRQARLILWHYEEVLKQKFAEFVSALEQHLQDTITNIRSKALGVVFDLLIQTPEQEQLLLNLLVNKVGDPDHNVASKASYLLRSLVTKHPNMKMVIVKAVEHLLYRPNISSKAQYYAVCFLNQIILNKNDHELASKLITIYFSFFKVFVNNSEIESKMLSALLTGVNRAFPFAKDEEDQYKDQLDMLFKVIHVGSFNTSIQALMLLLQVMDVRQSISDRYYTALYSKLLDPAIGTSSKQSMFLNTVYKSLKMDTSLQRVKAFIKRLLQVCSGQQPAFICGVLYLVSELCKVKPGIKSMIQQPEEEDDEEHFEDIQDVDDDTGINEDAQDDGDDTETQDDSTVRNQETSNDRKNELNSNQLTDIKIEPKKPKAYDSRCRNPLYCGAEGSCLWEIMDLRDHYHPSVCHFANLVSQGQDIVYKGDPLQDFTLMRFLDRFIYKNPKKKDKDHGGSLMQPSKVSARLKEAPVNSNQFLLTKEEDIREDEVFFYRYFKTKSEHDKKAKKKTGEDEDEESDDDNMQDDVANLDLDFASEVKMSKRESKKKKKKDKEDEDEEDDEEGSSDEEDFDYDNMDFEDEDEDEEDSTGLQQGTKRKFTDRDYEKALLDNISSDELESDDDSTAKTKKKKKTDKGAGEDIMSLFASADEFSHLLENSSSTGGTHDVSHGQTSSKQIAWEQRANQSWENKRPKSGQRGGMGRGRGMERGRGMGRGKEMGRKDGTDAKTFRNRPSSNGPGAIPGKAGRGGKRKRGK